MSNKKKRIKSSSSPINSNIKSDSHKKPQGQKKISGMLPVYIIVGLLFAGVLGSGMIMKFKRGNKKWGEKCSQDGICYPDKIGISRCTPTCGSDKTCPIGYRCETKINPRRRSLGMISVCVEKR